MKRVIRLASPRAGAPVHTSAHSHTSSTPPTTHDQVRNATPVERQAAIENALSMALYFVRQPGDTSANLWAVTARANRALTLLKQASAGYPTSGQENAMGRA